MAFKNRFLCRPYGFGVWAVIFILLLVSVSFAGDDIQYTRYFTSNVQQKKQQSESAAKTLSSSYSDRYGSSSGLKQNTVNPLMGKTNMTTLNGEVSFNAAIECPNPAPFLQLVFQPTGTHDFYVLISQDTDGDGHYDYQIRTPLVSGVCNNGFISCTQGTWSNCKYYAWVMENSKLTWQEMSDDTYLGMCFCVNSSCDFNIINQSDFAQVASVFGQGLADYVAKLYRFAISSVKEEFPVLTYYGQSADGCHVSSQSGETRNLSAYKDNPAGLEDTGESLANTETNDPNTAYYYITHNQYTQNNPSEMKKCEIKRNVSSSFKWLTTGGREFSSSCLSIDKNSSGFYQCWLQANCGKGCFTYGGIEGIFKVYLYSDDDFDFTVTANGSVLSGCTIKSKVYGTLTNTVCQKSEPARDPTDEWGELTLTFDTTSISNEPVVVKAVVKDSDGKYVDSQKIYGKFSVFLRRKIEITENKNDTCSNLNLDKCTLKDEQICDFNGEHCVYVVKDYAETGITLARSCHLVTDPETGEQWRVCADGSSISYYSPQDNTPVVLETGDNVWWDVKKTYTCSASGLPDISLEREKQVVENGNYDAGTGILDYPDTTQKMYGLGGYSNEHHQVKWIPGQYDNCTNVCIVRKTNQTKNHAVAGGSETANQFIGEHNVNKRKYLECEKDNNGNWRCPVPEGYELVQSCICLNNKPDTRTMAVFSALMQAAKDLICSQE